jgi:hypothetical protein
MMKVYAAAALLVIFVHVPGAYAIPRPEPEPSPGHAETATQRMFSGKVENVDVKGNVVVVAGTMLQEKKKLTFDVSDKTRIWKGKTILTIRDLERSMQVRVVYEQEGDRMTALTILVTDR